MQLISKKDVEDLVQFIFSPIVGIFHWKYMLTPIALPVFNMGGIKQRKLLIFGIRVLAFTV